MSQPILDLISWSTKEVLVRAQLIAAIAAISLVACEDDPEAPPVTLPIVVTISPRQGAGICEGGKVKFTAAVSGSNNTAVRWRSRSPLIAAVDSAGSVTGLAAGSACVVAAAAADTTARDSVSVTVGQLILYHSPPAVTLTAVSHNSNTAINPGNVSGIIDVYVALDIPDCWRGLSVRVKLNEQVVCNQGILDTRGVMLCILNTAESTATGQRRFPNGVASLKGEIVLSNGAIVAVSTNTPITLNNSP